MAKIAASSITAMIPTSKASQHHHFPPRFLLVGLGGIFILLLFYVSNFNNQPTTPTKTTTSVMAGTGEIGSGSSGGTLITQGVVGDDHISYYHCGPSSSDGEIKDLVLLHGSKFTKEDWKTSGILNDLCSTSSYPNLRVTAFDLPVTANHEQLMTLLATAQQNNNNNQLLKLPVTLVTPSASGKTVTDWVSETSTEGLKASLPKYVKQWIPVASGSVSQLSDEDVTRLKDLYYNHFEIYAIYGDEDTNGRKTSVRLKTLAGADVLELQGRHPVYLDSPKEFVTAITTKMGV
jgi:hypothetical protein